MRKLKITEMGRMTVEQFHAAEKMPLVVVLDGVRSLYNVGSVFRTSDAFRVAAVILCGITATPPNAEIHKTALGAEDSVAWRYFGDTMESLSWLRDEGYTLLAIEQCEGSTMLTDFVPDENKKYAVILGNEEIPQFGTKHSMNVSVTAGIIIWHFAQKRLMNATFVE